MRVSLVSIYCFFLLTSVAAQALQKPWSATSQKFTPETYLLSDTLGVGIVQLVPQASSEAFKLVHRDGQLEIVWSSHLRLQEDEKPLLLQVLSKAVYIWCKQTDHSKLHINLYKFDRRSGKIIEDRQTLNTYEVNTAREGAAWMNFHQYVLSSAKKSTVSRWPAQLEFTVSPDKQHVLWTVPDFSQNIINAWQYHSATNRSLSLQFTIAAPYWHVENVIDNAGNAYHVMASKEGSIGIAMAVGAGTSFIRLPASSIFRRSFRTEVLEDEQVRLYFLAEANNELKGIGQADFNFGTVRLERIRYLDIETLNISDDWRLRPYEIAGIHNSEFNHTFVLLESRNYLAQGEAYDLYAQQASAKFRERYAQITTGPYVLLKINSKFNLDWLMKVEDKSTQIAYFGLNHTGVQLNVVENKYIELLNTDTNNQLSRKQIDYYSGKVLNNDVPVKGGIWLRPYTQWLSDNSLVLISEQSKNHFTIQKLSR